jgi:HD-GYP domain-containing protein (c-di-GMP phosphodiesterase class II)
MKLMGYMLVLHDIGKLYIPSQILQKKEQLTDNEYDLIHMHPIYSYNIISTLKLPSIVAQTALFHHENINGTGYPYNIKICNNYVKLVSIIDIFDALVNDRPYKKSIDFYSAYDILFKMNIDITLAKKFITSII